MNSDQVKAERSRPYIGPLRSEIDARLVQGQKRRPAIERIDPALSGNAAAISRSRNVDFRWVGYRRSVIFANAPPLVSHFSCLFQGIWDSGFASGSLTRPTCSFWEAQETNTVVAASKRAAAIVLFRSGIRASIDDNVSRLHLDPSCQAAGNDIADSGRRFN